MAPFWYKLTFQDDDVALRTHRQCLGRVTVNICEGLTLLHSSGLILSLHSYTPILFSILTQNLILLCETLSCLKVSSFPLTIFSKNVLNIYNFVYSFCISDGLFLSYFYEV